jgi:hypothetical protein
MTGSTSPATRARSRGPAGGRAVPGFALWDSDLTMADLAAREPDRPGGRAVLAAGPAPPRRAAYRDEALHLAAAMQFLGYSEVVATLWSIADSPAPRVADLFYQAIAADSTPPMLCGKRCSRCGSSRSTPSSGSTR